MVPIIIGALETISKDIEKWLPEIGDTCRLESLRRACLLSTARILRKSSGYLGITSKCFLEQVRLNCSFEKIVTSNCSYSRG